MNKQLVHSKFEHIASSFPDNIAIEQGPLRLTYARLNTLANQVAHALMETGLGKGTVAGAWFENGATYVASILGINKAGMAFMPLDPGFPVRRQVQLLNSTELSLLVTDIDLLPGLLTLLADPDLRQEKITIIALGAGKITVHNGQGKLLADKAYPSDNPQVLLDGNDTNYLIYTSGSTGQPKIIEGCHKGLSHFIHWEIDEFKLDQQTKVSGITPLSFDVSFRDIFVPLLTAGTLCIPDKSVRFDPVLLIKWLASSGVTLMHCVPSLFRLLTDELQTTPDAGNTLPSLKYILLAGEPLFGKDITNWRTVAGEEIELVNIYGPTETTLAKLFYRVKDATFGPASIVPLGKAISNAAVLILNDDNQLCQIGEPGNIYIKTPFRSKGYYGQPQLTREKFIQNPLHNEFDDIVYITGDTGKYTEDLNVVFLGRTDGQVKVRGNRIELLEVEKVLSSFPGVSGVAVTVIQTGQDDDSVLACYYTGAKIDEAKVKSYLGNFLSQYMHPSHYIHLDAFPLTSSGKIDRRSLPVPDNLAKNDFEPTVGEVEQKLENIWKEVLKVPRVSRNESFFNIGGSSLRGIKVISKIYKECNVLLKLPDLFQHPTIRQLAQLLGASDTQQYVEIKPAGDKPWYQLSSAQKRLWILSHFEDQHVAYNLMDAFRIFGELDIPALEKALQTIAARHEVMRTVFISIDGEPMQKILGLDEFESVLWQEDLRGLPDPLNEALQLTTAELTTPFELKEGPLFRTRLLHLAENEFVFVFSRHHIISDGWSSALWIKEIRELYDAFVAGKPNPLPPLKIQYKDFAAWQNEMLQGDQLKKHQDYWVSRFTPAPPFLELPSDKIRPAVKTYSGKHYGTTFDSRLVKALTGLCVKKEATLFMGLLSALYILFYRLTGEKDLTVGTPITGREHEDLENLLGNFVNTLALRTQLKEDDTFLSLLEKVKEVASGAYEHQVYPFDYLIDQLDLARDLSHTPLFDVMIVMHDAKAVQPGGASLGKMSAGQFYVAPVVTKFDLNLNFTETPDGLSLEINYNNDVFSENAVSTMMNLYRNILSAAVAGDEKPIHSLQILDNSFYKALQTLNNTQRNLPPALTVLQLFEQQVKATPDAIALSDGNEDLDYRTLDERANAIARYLDEKHGTGVEDTVAVVLGRSIDFVVSILGIMKAGAAFAPVDADYPAERIGMILQDLSPRVIIAAAELPAGVSTAPVIILNRDRDEIYSHGGPNPAVSVTGSQLAYVLYTSGSTGTPKGVAIEHTSLLNYIRWSNDYYFDNKQGYSFAFNTSVSFDLTLTSIFTTLLRGDRMIVYGNDLDISGILLDTFDVNSGVSVTKLTPSHIRLLGNLGITTTKVRVAILGGEMLQEEHVAVLRSLNPDMRIYNEYGPTEATVGCIVREIVSDNDIASIGKPIDNTRIYIADPAGNLLPAGIRGEIYIAGDCLAREYYHNRDITDLRFKTILAMTGDERIYATGDLGLLNADGEIQLFGRNDRQIKIRGFRIEREEIERSLLRQKGVNAAIVTVVDDPAGEKQLVAHYTADQELNIAELRAALRQSLPAYMVPAWILWSASFPLTINGKLDERSLPDPFTSPSAAPAYVAPETPTESALVAIWESVFSRDRIGVEDDFFELGGHSLNAMRILSRIAREMDIRLTLKSLFTYTTIRALAQHMTQVEDSAAVTI